MIFYRTLLILSGLLSGTYLSQAQTAAYLDFNDRFHVYSNGLSQQLEHVRISNFKTGKNLVAYLDQDMTFKVYYNGLKETLSSIKPSFYVTTNNLLIYKLNSELLIYDQGKQKTLTYRSEKESGSDSMVAFVDQNELLFKVYYQKQIYTAEDVLNEKNLLHFSTGENICAWSGSNFFKVFYKGEVITLETSLVTSYACGRDLVVYYDEYNSLFKVFYKGRVVTLERFMPQKFAAGDELVAYVDDIGNFKVFDKGILKEVSSYEPSYFSVVDEIIYYGDDHSFNVYDQGRVKELENYKPKVVLADEHSLAYLDQQGKVNYYFNHASKIVSYEVADNYELYGEVLILNSGTNRVSGWYKGVKIF